jgi:transposase
MRKLREILRMHLGLKMSARAIARSCDLSPSTVSGYLARARVAKLSWPLPSELDEDEPLTRFLFPDERHPVLTRPEPDWARIHLELRKKHVTKQLLWEEYKAEQPNGYQYSQFCELYARWAATLTVTMRQTHRAGEKMFTDFSGDGLELTSPSTGEVWVAKLFLAVLGASSMTYVEPVLSEDLPTWVECHVHALEFFGGAAQIWVPDNLRSGVTRPDYYEPDLNPTYAELAQHYGAAVIPARVRKPRDKAKVEQGVLLAERWILAALRNRKFFSMEELRAAVKPLVEKLNDRPMRKLKKSRRELFEQMERSALKPLPTTGYEYSRWARPKVHTDYHVEFDGHFYSVPYQLVGKRLDLRATQTTVELFLGGRRVASHVRSTERGKHTTLTEHMPKSHQSFVEWTPVRLVEWAKKTGPATAALVEEIMRRHVHPQQGFRRCLGILHLSRHYETDRLEAACARALRMRAYTYKSVAAILRNNLDRQQPHEEAPEQVLPRHGNIRGPEYYN